MFDERTVEYARKECTIHSQLDHENIVKLHEYSENDKEIVMFMEYCNDANYFDDKIMEVITSTLSLINCCLQRHTPITN